MTVDVFARSAEHFDWAPSTYPQGSDWGLVSRIGQAAFPNWYLQANASGQFTRKQIDLLAAVLRLNGIEVIER